MTKRSAAAEDDPAAPRVESVPFKRLPGQSRLFLEHLAGRPELSKFYPNRFDLPIDSIARRQEVLSTETADRGRVCDALERLNRKYSTDHTPLNSIAALRRPDAVAILTGQQTGILGGPLYTLYKALSAINLAAQLRAQGHNGVPVFWMATDDHDLEEVSRVSFNDASGRVVSLERQAVPEDDDRPVGSVRLNDSIGTLLDDLAVELRQTEFTTELVATLRECWQSGRSFGEAFGAMIAELLRGRGLVIVDPLDPQLKQLAAPISIAAVEQAPAIASSLVRRSDDLRDAGYHAQVLTEPDYFPIFYIADDGRRVAMRLDGEGGVVVKNSPLRFSLGDLAEKIASEPARSSPGVMLRPVVQDYLFPTLCYFGGGAEVAYFAQNSVVYEALGRPATPIFHRQSFTIALPRHGRTLARYGLDLEQMSAGEEAVLPGIVDRFIDTAMPGRFAAAEESVNLSLAELDKALSDVDITLAADLATRRRKMLYHIAAMREKYWRRRIEIDETVGRRVTAAFNSLWPNGGLQERTIGIVSMLNELGPSFVDVLDRSVDLGDRGHRVIHL